MAQFIRNEETVIKIQKTSLKQKKHSYYRYINVKGHFCQIQGFLPDGKVSISISNVNFYKDSSSFYEFMILSSITSIRCHKSLKQVNVVRRT